MPRSMYIVVVLGAAIALGALIPRMVLWSRHLYGAVLPELVLFDNHRDRTHALSNARKSVHGDALVALLFGAMLLGLWTLIWRSPWWRLDSLLWHMTLFLLAPYFVAHVVFYFLFRQRLRRSLRHRLAERGHRVCVQCGYDTRHCPGPSCPECGDPLREKKPAQSTTAGQSPE